MVNGSKGLFNFVARSGQASSQFGLLPARELNRNMKLCLMCSFEVLNCAGTFKDHPQIRNLYEEFHTIGEIVVVP